MVLISGRSVCAAPAPSELKINLVDNKGTATRTYFVPADRKAAYDLLFQSAIPANLANHTSWAFEVSDPARNLTHQMEFDGKVPALIHWEGLFSITEQVQPNKEYFVRILLVFDDEKVVASIWTAFNTRAQLSEDEEGVHGAGLSLYVIPGGGFYLMRVQTATMLSDPLPCVSAELRMVYLDKHLFNLRFEGTSNILSFALSNTGALYYSDMSLSYRYQFLGSPMRPPAIPYVPGYGSGADEYPSLPNRAYGKPMNVEAGVRLFHTTFRGAGGTGIDAEYARNIQGLAAVAYGDHALGPFRFHLLGEAGYTLLRGSVMVLTGEAGFTFERMAAIQPGFRFRYQILSGATSPDLQDGRGGVSADISNKILMGGLVLTFKI